MMKKGLVVAVWVVPSLLLLAFTERSLSEEAKRDLALDTDERYAFAEEQARVRGRIVHKFVRSVADRDLFEGAIRGMVRALDDKYSSYLSEEDYRRMEEDSRGSYVGIGVTIGLTREGRLRVEATGKGSPAHAAGILPGDEIVAIDGLRQDDMTLDDAVRRIKGHKGETVYLTVVRRGASDEVEIPVVRDLVDDESVTDVRILDGTDGIGYLRITAFNDDTGERARRAVADLLERDAEAFVLDLRNNPGGKFETCREVIDLFVSEGDIVSTVGRDKNVLETFQATQKGSAVDDDVPLVVLINGRTASAAEIVAAALQDLRRARLVGTATFGKGSVQEVIPLGGELKTALKLTTAYWLRPSGKRTTPADPVRPDVEVVIGDADWAELLRLRLEGDHYVRPAARDADPVDTQLLQAIALLAGDEHRSSDQ